LLAFGKSGDLIFVRSLYKYKKKWKSTAFGFLKQITELNEHIFAESKYQDDWVLGLQCLKICTVFTGT